MNINECESEPCAPTGVCVDEVADYSCECELGYTGRHCDVDIDDCAPEPCQRGGICTDLTNRNYLCDCTNTGFTGTECHIDIDECLESTPCQNSGKCINYPGSFNCTCTAGFTGLTCLDVVESTPTFLLPIIIGVVAGVVLIIVLIVLFIVIVIVYKRRYSKRHDSYSPTKTESGRSEIAGFSTLPETSEPKERLI